VAKALDMVQLSSLRDRRPRQLSGGQQQRVALARALVIEPNILLLDEPLSNLDANLREEMRTEIRDIQQRLGITALFVTHDQAEALAICDRIAVMNAGNLEQLGTPYEIYERPANMFVASFVGRANRIRATQEADGSVSIAELHWQTARPCRAGPAWLMIRPHRIRLGQDGPNSARGRVLRTTYAGEMVVCEVDIGGAVMTVEQHTLAGSGLPRVGETAELSWHPEDTIVFPRIPSE
jgi:putative spermidine/putrescine transport system ATP-binding protein